MNKLKTILSVSKRFFKGLADGGTFGVYSALKSNKTSHDGGEGNVDFPKIIGYLIMGFIIFSVVFKDLAPETAEDLMKVLTRFGFFV
jgi:hypothetical protein|tara:strand:+ start:165 stop:425 length:261 start_codon:yes stop_codon:yes gene_type:complete